MNELECCKTCMSSCMIPVNLVMNILAFKHVAVVEERTVTSVHIRERCDNALEMYGRTGAAGCRARISTFHYGKMVAVCLDTWNRACQRFQPINLHNSGRTVFVTF